MLLLTSLLLLWGAGFSLPSVAQDGQMDTSEMLKPLVDTSGDFGINDLHKPPLDSKALFDNAEQAGAGTDAGTPGIPPGTKLITGKVQTLQQAMDSERDSVNWYEWYLGARDYLSRTGGLQCALGTQIKFYRDGTIEALTYDPTCRESVAGKAFALPRKTKLDALILPVRNGNAPPASPQELYSRINGLRWN